MDADRRRRFKDYFEQQLKGDRARLLSKTGFTAGRVSQLFDEAQPFGERAARSLADRLGLPPDYFDRDHHAANETVTDPLALILLTEFGSDAQRGLAAAARLRALADQLELKASEPAPPPYAQQGERHDRPPTKRR
jgi:hypothetical protein